IMRVTGIGLTLVGLLFVLAQSVQPMPTQARAAAEPVPWHPCARIRVACTQAGFVHNGTKRGRAVTLDCIRPIMTETPQRKEATKALPEIDPQVVAACKKRNPNFGKGGRLNHNRLHSRYRNLRARVVAADKGVRRIAANIAKLPELLRRKT